MNVMRPQEQLAQAIQRRKGWRRGTPEPRHPVDGLQTEDAPQLLHLVAGALAWAGLVMVLWLSFS